MRRVTTGDQRRRDVLRWLAACKMAGMPDRGASFAFGSVRRPGEPRSMAGPSQVHGKCIGDTDTATAEPAVRTMLRLVGPVGLEPTLSSS
jgi:hypothetical protein